MISFGPTEEQEVVRDAMREFAEQVLRPVARDADEASELPADVVQQAWDLGLTSTQLPDAYGGGGEERSPITNAMLLEELAYGDLALAVAVTSPSLFAFAVNDFGSEEQKRTHLPALCGSRFQAASVALIEPSPTFDVLNLQATAEPKGDGFVLSGRKRFVVLGDRADQFLIVARNSNATEAGFAAIDAFVVPKGTAGLTVGEVEKNLGLRGLPSVGLTLERVEVGPEARLPDFDAARFIASTRTANAALLVGQSRAVLDYAAPYAKDRHAFGQAIAQKQAVAFMLSDMHVETESLRWLTWRAASQLEQGLDATVAAAQAGRTASLAAMKIADNGVQVLGGHGFIREHPVEMWYRHTRTLSVLEGVAAI